MKVEFEIDDNALSAVKLLQLMYDMTGYSLSSLNDANIMLDHAENQDYEIVFSETEEKYGFLIFDENDIQTFIIPLY